MYHNNTSIVSFDLIPVFRAQVGGGPLHDNLLLGPRLLHDRET